MERNIRALKREKEALTALGDSTTEINAKIKRKTAEYKDFCKTCGVPTATSRLWYECGMSDLKKTKAWNGFEVSVIQGKKTVAEQTQSVKMNISEDKGNVTVHSIGKIDREIYKCITEDIVTDEVIITDERIKHVKERHPDDYERFCSYIPQIIEEPDYIIKANKPNTATILKEIMEDGKKFQLVLRIKTSGDDPAFKNSVITFLNINERTWNKYLRNKEILYKRE